MGFSKEGALLRMPSILRAACGFALSLFIMLVLIVFMSLFPQPAFAEGSKDLVSKGGYRPYTEQCEAVVAGESHLTEVGVYVKTGELLYFGSSAKTSYLGLTNDKMNTELSDDELADLNDNHVVLCDPSWDEETNPYAYPYVNGIRDESIKLYRVDTTVTGDERGYIFDHAEEMAGPKIAKLHEGYTPHSFRAPADGVYYLKFYSSDQTTQSPCPAQVGKDENFESNQGSTTVAAWDVSVYSAEGVAQSGRVFVDELFLNMGASIPDEEVLTSSVYVLTNDGYEYLVDFNGMDPVKLMFFSNARGLLFETENGDQSLYHSVRSDDWVLSDLAENGIVNNIKPTEAADKSHRIFFEAPDEYAIESYTGSKELADGSVSLFDQEITFTPGLDPYKKENATIVGFGGSFSFENDGSLKGSSFQITIDFSSSDFPDNKVILSNALVFGTNTVYWDGLDHYGNVVEPGVYDKNLIVDIKGGEAHFPLIDVANNQNGIKVALVNDIAALSNPCEVHYDNLSNKASYSGVWDEKNWTVADGRDETEGVSSENGAMAYTNGLGEQAVLDLWTYQGKSVSYPFSFEVYCGEMGFSVSQTWDTTGDVSETKPHEGDEVALQLQWRIKDSADAWVNYGGSQSAYHKPLVCATHEKYDTRQPLFTGLEEYVGKDSKGEAIVYQYRVVADTLPDGYKQHYYEFDVFDFKGVARVVDLQYVYAPYKGIVSINKRWIDDSSATDVRPEEVRVEVFCRVAGSEERWLSLPVAEGVASYVAYSGSKDPKDLNEGVANKNTDLVLTARDGWTQSILVDLSDENGVPLEYRVVETAYSMEGSVWVELALSDTVPSARQVLGKTRVNAPGYSAPEYVVDGAVSTTIWSEPLSLSVEKAAASIEIVDVYQTALVVSHTWEKGVSSGAAPSVVVQLQKDGVDVEGAFIELTEDQPRYTFDKLDMGHSYTTRLLSSDKNYSTLKKEAAGESGYSLIDNKVFRGYYESYLSTYMFTSFTVSETWKDGLNTHDPVIAALNISFNDGRAPYSETVELSEKNGWTYTFKKLEINGDMTITKTNPSKKSIDLFHAVAGTNLSGYRQIIDTVEEKATIVLTKSWEGDEQASEVRPQAIKMKLWHRPKGSNDEWAPYGDSHQALFELSALNRWTYSVDVEVNHDGVELEYCVQEISYKAYDGSSFEDIGANDYATGYSMPQYSLDGGPEIETVSPLITFDDKVTAKIVSKSTYTTSFTAVVLWAKQVGHDEKGTSTVQLQRNGEDIPGMTANLDEENSSYTFLNLPTGSVYSIRDVVELDDYEDIYTSIEGEDGFSSAGKERERGYYQGITKVRALSSEEVNSELRHTDSVLLKSFAIFGLVVFVTGLFLLGRRLRRKA